MAPASGNAPKTKSSREFSVTVAPEGLGSSPRTRDLIAINTKVYGKRKLSIIRLLIIFQGIFFTRYSGINIFILWSHNLKQLKEL